MGAENENTAADATNTNGSESASGTQAAGAGQQPAQGQAAQGGRGIVMHSPKDMAEIRRLEREKGKRAAAAEIAAKLKAAGAESLDELIARAKGAGNKPASRNETQPRPQNQGQQSAQGEDTPSNRQLKREQKAEADARLEEARAAHRREEKKRRELERRLAQQEVDSKLRTAAVKAGIKDVDVALILIHQELDRMGADGAKAFDEDKWFAELAKSRPYLAGTVDKPATTGPANPTMPTPPKPGKETADAANGKGFDATKANPVDVERRWRELGSTGTN